MAFVPRLASLRRSLAVCALAASVLIGLAPPAVAAASAENAVATAWSAYFQGRSLAAREGLTETLAALAPGDPQRFFLLETLLDICIHSRADACVQENIQAYVDAAGAFAAVAPPDERALLVLRGGYYFDQGRLARHSPSITREIFDWAPWKIEQAPDPRLELQRQVLAANIHYELDDYAAARASIDKLLALLAAIEAPQEDRFTVAWALLEAISTLAAIGETDRAYGLYRAVGPALVLALPHLSVEAALFRLTEAMLLQEQGDLVGADRALDDHVALVREIELEPDVRAWLLAQALTSKAAGCAVRLALDCAREALAQHEFSTLYQAAGRRPASYDEVAYLTTRAAVAAFGGGEDPIAANALKGPLGFAPSPVVAPEIEVYRALGGALGQPPGGARGEGLFDAGRRLIELVAREPRSGFGAWRRLDPVEQVIVALALTQVDSRRDGADETVFALMQLANRQGSTFDADAQTLLAQARDDAQRRTIHQALRLQARRDQLERQELTKLAARLARPRGGVGLAFDAERRKLLVAVSAEIAAADANLARGKVRSAGANLVTLRQLQRALKPGETALASTPAPGGFAYACIRRDTIQRKMLPQDLRRLIVDLRVVQMALTATHAPSEALDTQFPVEAATRLYDTLIRPFDGCLRPGDHILWLPNASLTPLPLSVFLEGAPPKLAKGYDLAAAGWLIRRHTVSYPGAASTIVATRGSAAPPAPKLDFLGVGDPILSPRKAPGIPDFSHLPALPETRQELEQSARGFRTTKLITGDQATERVVRGELLGAYRYLSFATHGLVRGELEGLSEPALALTPGSADRGDDGLLTASEIADMSLAARFVALSACNTANVDLSRMSGDLAALASAFVMAGAPSVLGALWPVETETGKQVVSATFHRLAEQPADGAALALARAQRSFLDAPPGRAYLHPRFWAPFVLLGDGAAAAR